MCKINAAKYNIKKEKSPNFLIIIDNKPCYDPGHYTNKG